MPTYRIVRHYAPHPWKRDASGFPVTRPSKTIKRGLTLEEARKHCNDPKTHKEGVWFDGYTKE